MGSCGAGVKETTLSICQGLLIYCCVNLSINYLRSVKLNNTEINIFTQIPDLSLDQFH